MRYLFGRFSFVSILAHLFALCFVSMAAAGALTLTVGDQTNPTSPVSFSVNEGQTLIFQVVASDTDPSKKIHLQGSSLPTGASFTVGAQSNPRSATFSWTPSSNQKGSYTGITFTAAERGKGGVTRRATVNITVGKSNHAPVLQSPGDKTVNEGETLSFTLSASDQDVGDVLTYGAGDLPQGATLDPITGHFTWTPGFDQAGSYVITLRATDNGQPALGSIAQSTIVVGHVNRPPAMSDIGSFTVTEGETLGFQIFAQDPDGDTLAFSAKNVPDGASFDPATQMFTWSPTLTQSGNYQVTFSATDGMNGTASKMATITVNNVNRPPTLDHIGSQIVDEGATLAITLTGQDPDGDSLTYSAENLPDGATVAGQTFTWSPTSGQVGAYDITFKVTDSGEPPASASEIVHITVNAKGNIQTFTVTYSSGGNGTITCASPVNYNSSSTCAIIPATGYRLASITDNGTDVKKQISGSTYTVPTVAANHSISVGFEPDVTNILWRNTATGQNEIWTMNGTSRISVQALNPSVVADTNWKIVGTGDFNGDGYTDLVWYYKGMGMVGVWLMNGTDLSAAAWTTPNQLADTNWNIVGIGDFNGDGKPDIVWQHDSGYLGVWLMNGTTMTTAAWLTPSHLTDPAWRVVGVGDFNGDGKPDLLWYHTVGGWLGAWLMDGTSMTTAVWLTPSTLGDMNWRVAGVGDFNADGKPDILWQHSTGSLGVWLMNGTTMTAAQWLTPSSVSDPNWRIVGCTVGF